MFIRIALFSLFFLTCQTLHANPADSLEQLINSEGNQAEKIRIMFQFAELYTIKDSKHFYEINTKILDLAKSLKSVQLIAKANENLGDYYWSIFNRDRAVYHYNEALDIYSASGQDAQTGTILYEIAVIYNQTSNYKVALQYAREALEKYKTVNDQLFQSNVYALLCDIQSNMGLKDKAINDCIASLRIIEETGSVQGKSNLFNSIGRIYFDLNQLDRSEQYFLEALSLSESHDDSENIATALILLGDTYTERGDFNKAFLNYERALEIHQKSGDIPKTGETQYKIGKAYLRSSFTDQALTYLNAALLNAEKSLDIELRSNIYSQLGNLYSERGNYRTAIIYLKKSLADAQKINADPILQSCYNNLAKYYDKLNDKENALIYFKLYMLHREEMFQIESAMKIAEAEALYNLEEKEKEIRILRSENRIKDLEASSKNMTNILLISGLIFVISLTIVLYRQYRIQNKANYALQLQRDAINKQKQEIEIQRDNIKYANSALEEKNSQITDSIEYAKRIQLSLLPDPSLLKKIFSGSFQVYLPKNIVSGDFFWLQDTGDKVYIAAIDCTGHGVPGAFMTVLAHSLLNQVVSTHPDLNPDQVITELDKRIKNNLNQHGITLSAFEGMDIALCVINKSDYSICYSGAKMPLYLFKDNGIIQLDADRFTVGGYDLINKIFTLTTDQLTKGDMIYLATDGFQDQFGGQSGKKFMKTHFRTLLDELAKIPIVEQPKKLIEIFNAWKGNFEQTDDVLIIGIQI